MTRPASRVKHVDVPDRQGLRLDVRDTGPRDGEVVVLLHGFPQDSRCWDAVVPSLHQAGLRTLAPDQRGYSADASPTDVSAYRVEALAGDVLRLLDRAGTERAHVAGHDWGGVLAWHLAAHHADRVASLTVLSTPHPRAFAWSLLRSDQGLRSWYAAAVQVPVLPERILSATLAPALRLSGLPLQTADAYAGRLATASALQGPLNWYRAAARHSWRAAWTTIDSDIVTVPTTYVWGRRDPALGRAAAYRSKEYVHGEYRFVELDAGHWLPELEPAAVARELIRRVAGSVPQRQPGS